MNNRGVSMEILNGIKKLQEVVPCEFLAKATSQVFGLDERKEVALLYELQN